MTYTFIAGRCSDLPVATCCRVMKVSTSGFYSWRAQPWSDRDYADAVLTNTIVDIHRMSRCSYGSPRVHAELRLGQETFCSRKRVERLMREAGVAGIYRRRNRGCTRRDPAAVPNDDLVGRQFDPKHIRSELVVDALQMAVWRRQPPEGQTIAHSDHGTQYTSWAFGKRLRKAGLLGSMGSIGDCFDNSVAESFFGTLQLELLDEHRWATRDQLANAIFDWIETWYNPRRRHSYCQMLSPIDYETATAA